MRIILTNRLLRVWGCHVRRFCLNDLQARRADGVIHGSDHVENRVGGLRQRGARSSRLNEGKAIIPGNQEMFLTLINDSSACDDLHQNEDGVGFLCSTAENGGVKMSIGFECDEDEIRLLIDGNFCNARLALQSRLDGGPAGASERAIRPGRSPLDLRWQRSGRNEHQKNR